MTYTARYFVLAALVSVTSLQSMHLVRKLGPIDRRIILRHAKQVGTRTVVKSILNGKPAEYVKNTGPQDIARFQMYPTLRIETFFTRDSNWMPHNTISSGPTLYHVDTDTLARDIFAIIDTIEKKSGYLPRNITHKTDNTVTVRMPTNWVDHNTRYWRTGFDGHDVECETTLYREHADEIRDLLNHFLPKDKK